MLHKLHRLAFFLWSSAGAQVVQTRPAAAAAAAAATVPASSSSAAAASTSPRRFGAPARTSHFPWSDSTWEVARAGIRCQARRRVPHGWPVDQLGCLGRSEGREKRGKWEGIEWADKRAGSATHLLFFDSILVFFVLDLHSCGAMAGRIAERVLLLYPPIHLPYPPLPLYLVLRRIVSCGASITISTNLFL
ncbi:uncharacterized protein K452DRAFT_95473 [Aplosporella prunicola CBS 121167]|uniref:Secreted protein n=1 Tax=Aplosporella prunicola CBS 121167 TaxID=1176127 RepID=A0A6A6B421_9PEZI|nr:uncharacterized protein K452DRAFT_95473 [Aplosporella prunicola CBS 121167]KAF2138123.1 hypothetical protein K452DRAFT_95473 [Aplosporella prunicola CBS 121167]